MAEDRGWNDLEIIPIRITGKWITGILVQENKSGKRRVKLFKGLIKETGTHVLKKDGREYRFSMVQRFNIPSLNYWLRVSEEVTKVLREYVEGGKGQSLITEFKK